MNINSILTDDTGVAQDVSIEDLKRSFEELNELSKEELKEFWKDAKEIYENAGLKKAYYLAVDEYHKKGPMINSFKYSDIFSEWLREKNIYINEKECDFAAKILNIYIKRYETESNEKYESCDQMKREILSLRCFLDATKPNRG